MSPTSVHNPADNSDTNASLDNSPKLPVDEHGEPLKPCCACPETRKPRDDCVLLHGEEECHAYIEAHRACLRSYGFQV